MGSMTLRIVGIGLLVGVGLLGCSSEGHEADPVAGDGQSEKPRPDPALEPIPTDVEYPKGPYGANVGAIIDNYEFIGYPDSTAETVLQPIDLASFYNPTGNGTYAEDAPFNAGEPKPKALLINVSARWCAPCNLEAKETLPGKYAELKPLGGEFLVDLADGNTPGEAATEADLQKWTSKYDIDYPAALDPTYRLAALFDANAFPANFIIRTSTMEIVEVVPGTPSESFWETFRAVLAEGP
jgi:hypothetical protein